MPQPRSSTASEFGENGDDDTVRTGEPGLDPRLLGVSVADVEDWRQPEPASKWSRFFGALSAHGLNDVVLPRLSRTAEWLNLAASFRPGKDPWLARAGFNLRHLRKVNAALGAELESRRGSYDLIVQLQTLCAPPRDVPFVVYTDNTMALTQRLWPTYAPLSSRDAQRWEGFERSVFHRARTVFTFSEFARRSVIDDYGRDAADVVAVGAGANLLLTSAPDRSRLKPSALFVGMQFERKGGSTLLEAWPAVRARVPDAELVIAGPREDPGAEKMDGVRWVGRVGRAEVERLYMNATVFVMPSTFEPWGFVFAEAMGAGLPCIGTDCCAMPEIIEDGVSGRVVAPGDPGALTEALVELLGDSAQASAMGRAGHRRVMAELTWPAVAARLAGHLGPWPQAG
jgi:glycosyltransferase involved in cell wall biosynthesis